MACGDKVKVGGREFTCEMPDSRHDGKYHVETVEHDDAENATIVVMWDREDTK